ncbi:hypothetical protein FD755_004374 [Muntiacus reevesi]|uniref:S-phase kinase-associated protein 1 n=1 Tax=Muntiacus reevesi TaxID=9886 RepID=A0A5J5MRI4_MUNRE|nr:hypothetical protein FD755_004374 [Muntiacus reevesi]
MPSIKFQSSDGDIFKVDVETAKQSVTVKTILEDLRMDDEDDVLVPLPNWDENKEKRTDDNPVWDQDFLKAKYLDIKVLLDVTCKTVPSMIQGKTPEEIQKTFNIKNDFTEEEEAHVCIENQWCEK